MSRIVDFFKQVISKRALIPKVFSLLLAVALWAYIGSTKMGNFTFKVQVEFKRLPSSLVISKVNLTYITIELKGRKEELKNLTFKNVKAFINLENARVGDNQKYPIELTKNEIPDNISVGLSSRNIVVNIERKISKRIKVVPRIAGSLKKGFIAGNIKVTPEYVVATGAESVIKDISEIFTNEISVEKESARVVRDISLDKTSLRNISLNAETVNILIPVIEVANLTETECRVEIRNAREGFKYSVKNDKIRVYLKSRSAADMDKDYELECFLDVAGINPEKLLKDIKTPFLKDMRVSVAVKKGKEYYALFMVVPDRVILKVEKD